jgi:hypothetical protein
MTTDKQRHTITQTLAALVARSEANASRDKANQATDPAEKAHHDRAAADADQRARDHLAEAATAAQDHGADQYADTMRSIQQHLTPDDPTETPDPLAQAAAAMRDASLAITGQMVPLFQNMSQHLARALHDNSAHDPDAQHGHELYGASVDLGDDDGPEGLPRVIGVKVTHLRTHAGDPYDILNAEAALQLAEVHPSEIFAIVSEGLATNAERPDEPKRHARCVVIVTPLGMRVSSRLWDADTRTWGQPAQEWYDTANTPDDPLTQAVAAFYTVHMVAAHVLGNADA